MNQKDHNRISIDSVQHWRVMLSDEYRTGKVFALFTSLKKEDVRIPRYVMEHYNYAFYGVDDEKLWNLIRTGKTVNTDDGDMIVVAIEKIPGDPMILN